MLTQKLKYLPFNDDDVNLDGEREIDQYQTFQSCLLNTVTGNAKPFWHKQTVWGN